MSDYDADQIRAQKLKADFDRLLPHLPRLVALAEAITPPEIDEAKAKEHFDLGNRVEDALKALDAKVREVGDLPDRLRSMIDDAERSVKVLESVVESHNVAKSQFEQMMNSLEGLLKASQAIPPKAAESAPPQTQTEAENAEALKEIAERTTRKPVTAETEKPQG